MSELLTVAQDSIDFLRRALIQRDADFCQQRTEIERLTGEVNSKINGYTLVIQAHAQTIERLTAALAGEVGLVELLVARAELRAERDEILSNHRHSEACAVLREKEAGQ